MEKVRDLIEKADELLLEYRLSLMHDERESSDAKWKEYVDFCDLELGDLLRKSSDFIEGVPIAVFEEYEQIRTTGIYNMLDVSGVLLYAAGAELHKLVNFCMSEGQKNTTKQYTKILEAYGKWYEKVESEKKE